MTAVETIDATESEIELRDLLYGLVRMLKPQLVVETGAYKGGMTWFLGCAVNSNESGEVVSYEPVHEYWQESRERCIGLPVTIMQERATEATLPLIEEADFLFLDSDYKYRADEIARAKKGATIVVHDAFKSYDPSIAPLAPLIEEMGGLCFRCGIEGRGFGILVKR